MPAAASSDATIRLTGTGFASAPGDNVVTITPSGQAQGVTASVTAVSAADAAGTTRRLTVRIPAGLPVGRASVRVRNAVTGEQSDTATFEVVALRVSPAFVVQGATADLQVSLSGSAQFEAGTTRVAFGSGIAVNRQTVLSPTQLIANVSVSPTASTGPRSVGVITPTLTAVSEMAVVSEPPPPPPTNTAPVFTSTPPLTATVGTAYAYTATATDADGDPVLFVLVSGPTGFAIAPNGVVSWTPTPAQVGAQAITIEARDGKGGNTAQSFTVTVGETSPPPPPPPTNTAPVFTSTPLLTATVGTAYAYTATATDADGDAVLFVLVSGPAGFAIAPNGGVSWTPTPAQVGAQAVTIEARDGRGGSTPQTFTVTVSETPPPPPPPPTNTAPVFTSTPPLTATVGTAYAYTATATDADGDPVLFALVNGPAGFSVAPNGVVSWTPTPAQVGAQAVTIEARDGKGGNTAQSFTVTVGETSPPPPTNRAPTAAFVFSPASPVTTDAVLFDAGTSSDPDGDALTYAWTFETLEPATGVVATRTFPVAGIFTVTLTVDDGRGGVDSETKTVSVTAPANRPPTVSFTVTPASPVAGEAAAFDASASSDPDGDDLTFSWDFGDAVPVGGVQASRVFAVPGTYSVRLTVTDSRGASAELRQQVIVGAVPNRPPTAAFTVSTTSPLVDATVSFDASASLDPDGDALTFAWSFGDGVAGTGAQVGHAFSAPGTFPVSLTVRDGRGGSATASQTVTVSATPPVNRPPSAVITGATRGTAGVAVAFDGRGSSDPDNDPLTYAWDFGVSGSGASSPTPSFIYPEPGTFTVSLTVRDGQGASSTATRSIVIDPAADRTPPVITLSGPAQALPGTTVTFTADASDNVGVNRVRFTVDDGAPTDVAVTPYERQVALPAVAAPDQQVVVAATAFDAAGNAASATAALTLRAVPDTTPPLVLLLVPATTSPGARLLMSARVSDDSGVAEVAFFVDGQEIARVGAPPYAAQFTVAAGAVAGQGLPVVARASDVAGNTGEDAASVLVVAIPDTTAPTVTLDAPSQALPGERVTVNAAVADEVGVAEVAFAVDEAALPLQTVPPFTFSYVVPPQAPAGSRVQVTATARDFSANAAQASATIAIVAPQATTRSIVSGEVYDDTTGLPLAAVTVQLSGTSALGLPYGEQTTTDVRGRYTIRAVSGAGRLRLSKPGYTHVWREVTLPAGAAVEPVDARLTPSGGVTPISGLSGATLVRGAHALVVPAGVLGGAPQVTMTVVSGQGLRALLPPGWSPVGAIDLGPDALSLTAPATWRAPDDFGVGGRRPVIVARYDETGHAWRATGLATPTSAGQFEAPVSRGGQHVLVVPDAAPAAPVLPGAGALVTGVAAPTLDQAALGALAPSPTVLFYKPGVFSTVTSSVTPSAATSSGLVLRASVSESYAYMSGDSVTTDPYSQDLVFYQVGADANGLAAVHVVSPSLVFDPLTLNRGVISVALVAVPPGVGVPLAGPDGGMVEGQNGTALVVPPGALPDQTPLTLDTFDASGLAGLLAPPGLSIAGAMQLGFEGTLQLPAALSIPQPAGLTDPSRALLVQVMEVGGRTRLVLRALARLSGGRLVSDVTLGGMPTPLEGVRTPGRYLFLRSDVPLGFAAGLVRAAGGVPFAGALVSTSSFAPVSLSRGDGAYFAAAPSGPTTLLAADLVRGDRGTGAATLPFNNVAPLDLTLAPQPPTVTSITPANGAVNVALSSAITVTFSKPIDPATLTGSTVTLAAGASAIASTLALSSTGRVLTVRPEAPLAPNTAHAFTLAAAIGDLSGNRLGAPVSVSFETLDTNPPPLPPAGSITASIPANGVTTVSASQGTASPRDRVTIRNLATRQQQVALVNGDGSFSASIAAALAHRLQIVIRDQAGNETVVDVPRYRNVNLDGSVSSAVTSEGGTVEGPGGIAATIQPGTFPQGAVVTLQAVAEADFPVQLSTQDRQYFSYTGGVSIDFGGAEPQEYVDLSIPAAGDEPRDRQWVVARAVNVAGRLALEPVDSARRSGSRIITSSPPCPGVMAAGVYGFLNATYDLGYYYTDRAAAAEFGVITSVEWTQVGTSWQLPFLTFSLDVPRRWCMPVLTGRVTVVRNTVKVRVPGSELAPADRLVIVQNSTTSVDGYATRDVAEFVFTMAGEDTNTYQVVATGPGGQVPVPIGAVAAAAPGEVRLTLDPDQILVPITQVEIRNVSTGTSQVFPVATPDVDVAVDGALSDGYSARARNASHAERPVSSSVLPPTVAGNGNMLLRVRRGTIDPTRAELDAIGALVPAREHVYVDVDPDGAHGPTAPTRLEVPAAAIVQGGTEWAFNAPDDAEFTLIARYDQVYGLQADQRLVVPVFRLTAANAVTGRVLKAITVPAPPRDQPMSLPPLTNDTTPPFLVSGPPRLDNFDPAGQFSFTFSESMNVASLRQAFQVELKVGSTYKKVTNGEIRVSNRNRTVTFVPANGLRLAAEYRITLAGNDSLGQSIVPTAGLGIRDGAGNGLPTTVFTVKTAAPRIAGRLFNDAPDLDGDPAPSSAWPPPAYAPFEDVSLLRHEVAGVPRRTLFVTAGKHPQHDQFLTVDVTEPTAPAKLRATAPPDAGPRRQRATYVGNVTTPTWLDLACAGDPAGFLTGLPPEGRVRSACPPGTFHGDIVVTTTFNLTYSLMSVYDVSDVEHPRWMANKMLTVTPLFLDTLNLDNQRGMVKIQGFAKGVAAIGYGDTVRAFAAVEGVGVMAADLSEVIPNRQPAERGSARDVGPVFNGDFTDIVRFRDYLLALEKTEGRLYVLDPTLAVRATLDLPEEPCTLSPGNNCRPWLRRIQTAEQFGTDANFDGLIEPSETFDLAIIGTSRRVFVVNVTTPTSPALLGTIHMPGIVRDLSIDPVKRRLFVVGERTTAVGNQQLMLVDLTDLGQGFAADEDQDGLDDRIVWVSNTQANGVEADPERGLAYVTTQQGLEVWTLETCCDLGVDTAQSLKDRPQGDRQALLARERAALQQGIAAGLNAAQAECTGFVASSVSMLEQGSGACLWKPDPASACSDNYQPGVSDHDFEVFFPNSMLTAGSSGSTASCVIDRLTVQFIDPVSGRPKPIVLPGGARVSFEDITFFPVAREEFESARLNILPPASGGADASGDMGLGRQQLLLKWLLEGEYVTVPGFSLQGESLDVILDRLKTQTGIPVVEGYEWSVLQETQLAKAKAYIRIAGSSSPTSTMHGFFIKQMHDAGKAGIRSALARMVADPHGNATVLDITRARYAADGCVVPTPLLSNPSDWTAKPCTSFEEYVASAAARTLQRITPLPIFTEPEVRNVVYRFFRVKADLETPSTDAAADAFIATVAAFIQETKTRTQPAYQDAIQTDPQAAQRTSNLATAAAKLTALLSEAKVHVTPHVFNRGFRNAKAVEFKFFVRSAGGSVAERRSITVDLNGGDERILDFERNADGTLALDPQGRARPLFVLGPIDQQIGAGQPGHVAFTIDLPGKVMQEADRQNNYDGFFYYVLPLAGALPGPPSTAAKVPLPFPDPGLLEPDAVCGDVPPLRITQRILRGTEVLGGIATASLGEQLTIRLVVENLSSLAQPDATACSTLAGVCVSTGPLAPGAVWTHDIPYTVPTLGTIADAVATLTSSTLGVVTSVPARLAASCEAYRVLPLDPNPNPDEGTIGRGGSALRYFRVVNPRTGAPLAGAAVSLELYGTDSSGVVGLFPLTAQTDAQGRLVSQGEPGLAIPFSGGPAAYPDGSSFKLKVAAVNGVAPVCDTAEIARLKLTDLEYSESFARGTGIEGTVGFIASVEGGLEGGLELERTDKVTESGVQPKELEVERALKLSGKTGVGFSLFKFSGSAVLVKATVEAEASVEAERSTEWKTKWGFTYPFDATANCNLADITLAGLWGVNPIFTKLIDLARSQPCVNLDRNLKSSATAFGRQTTAGAQVALKVETPFGKIPQPGEPSKDGLAVSFGGSGSSGFSLETSYEMSYGPGTAGSPPALTGNKEEYKLKGGFDWSASLGFAHAEIDADPGVAPGDKAPKKEEVEVEYEGLKAALDFSASGTTAETYGLAFEWDFTRPSTWPDPSSISVTYAGPKLSGVKAVVGGPALDLQGPANRQRVYKFENRDDISFLVQNLANLGEIRNSNVGSGALRQLVFEPTVLTQELGRFFAKRYSTRPTYADVQARAVGADFPIGVTAKLAGFSLGIGASLKAEAKVKYTTERGVFLGGTQYPLEKYSPSLFPSPSLSTQLWSAVETSWNAIFETFSNQFSDKQATAGGGGAGTTTLQSDFTATLTIDNAFEPVPFEAGLFSYRYEPRPADPAIDVQLLPTDTFGPEGTPHYGVGGFHQFWPANRMLAVPARLVIDYQDAEVAGFDESTLAIYRWNQERQDWDFVGGIRDQTANTVTTFIRRLGLYTLGLEMPAGPVPLIFMNGGQMGVDEDRVQRFQVITDTLTLNTGGPVPDGTVYTVRSLYPASGSTAAYGRVIATDVDPVREGVQVASQNGVIAFDVEFPAPFGKYRPGRILVYATRGTAAGDVVLVQ